MATQNIKRYYHRNFQFRNLYTIKFYFLNMQITIIIFKIRSDRLLTLRFRYLLVTKLYLVFVLTLHGARAIN